MRARRMSDRCRSSMRIGCTCRSYVNRRRTFIDPRCPLMSLLYVDWVSVHLHFTGRRKAMTIGCTCGMVGCSFGCMQRQRDALRAELAAYKRAKGENDERFMVERDQARAELAECGAELEAAKRWDKQAADARAERLREALCGIANSFPAHGDEKTWIDGVHIVAKEALAETAQKTSEGKREALSDAAHALPSIHSTPGAAISGEAPKKPGTSSPDDAERVARRRTGGK